MNKRNSMNQEDEDAPYKKYLPPVFILLTTILICLAWGTVWSYWLEYDWFPQAKDFVPGVILPMILAVLHLIICFRWIRSLSDNIEKFVWIGLFAFSTLIFSNTTGFVKKQKASYVIADVTVKNLHLFGEKDYIKINNLPSFIATRHVPVPDCYTLQISSAIALRATHSERLMCRFPSS